MDPHRQFNYVTFQEIGYNPDRSVPTQVPSQKGVCILDPEHPKRVRTMLGINEEDINRRKGDAVIAVSDIMLYAQVACIRFWEGAQFPLIVTDDEALAATAGDHYVVMRRRAAPGRHIEDIFVRGDGKVAVSLQPTLVRTLAHELGHALEFYDKDGNALGSACDEYSLGVWTMTDLLLKKGYFGKAYPQGCPNRYPPCCTEAGGNTCSVRDPSEPERVCLGMPIGYEDWTAEQFRTGFETTPDKEFSIIGYGNTIPSWFPAPLPKLE